MLWFDKKVQDPDEVEGCKLRRKLRKELSTRITEMERVVKLDKLGNGRKEDLVGRTDDEIIGLVDELETLKDTRTRLQKVRTDAGKKFMGYLYAMSDYQRVSDKQRGNSGEIQDYFVINMNRYYDLVEKEGKKPHKAIEMMNREIIG